MLAAERFLAFRERVRLYTMSLSGRLARRPRFTPFGVTGRGPTLRGRFARRVPCRAKRRDRSPTKAASVRDRPQHKRQDAAKVKLTSAICQAG